MSREDEVEKIKVAIQEEPLDEDVVNRFEDECIASNLELPDKDYPYNCNDNSDCWECNCEVVKKIRNNKIKL